VTGHMAKIRSLMLIGFLLASSLSILSMYVAPVKAQYGDYWLAGFNRRRLATVTGAGSAGSNYAIRVRVHNGSGVDSGRDVYIGTNHLDDFGDIRFTASNGITELSYFYETPELSNPSYADFWVRITNDLSAGNTVYFYLYYDWSGASRVHTTSDGTATFDFFDDFNQGSQYINDSDYNPSIHKWVTSGSWITQYDSDYDGDLREIREYGGPDPRASRMKSATSNNNLMYSGGDSGCQNFSMANVRFRSRYLKTHEDSAIDAFTLSRFVNSTRYYTLRDDDDGYLYLQKQNGSLVTIDSTSMPDSANSYHVWEIATFTLGSTVEVFGSVDYNNGNTYAVSYNDSAVDRITESGYVGYRRGGSNTAKFFEVDWCFAHKYVNPEPSITSWSSEETCSDSSWLGDGSTSWGYRQNFTIAGDSSSQRATNYLMLFKVYAGSEQNQNSSYGAHYWDSIPMGEIYTNGSAQNDLDDVRFTASDGITVLPQFVAYVNSTENSAYIWVKIPEINVSTSYTFYIYYGMAEATRFSESWFYSSKGPFSAHDPDDFFHFINEDQVSCYGQSGSLANNFERDNGGETMNGDSNGGGRSHAVRLYWNNGGTSGETYLTSLDYTGTSSRRKKHECPSWSVSSRGAKYRDIFENGVDWALPLYDDWRISWYQDSNGPVPHIVGYKSSGGSLYYYSGHLNVEQSGTFSVNYNYRFSPRVGGFFRAVVDPEPKINVVSTIVESGGSAVYYFDFSFQDLDGGAVDSHVTWILSNASGSIPYTEGEARLTSGIYTLEIFRYGQLINSTILDTSTKGNSTVTIYLNMKYHTHRANAYITSNNTISSITIHEQTSINLTFTISGATPCLLIIDVGGVPTNLTKDGGPFSYSYHASPTKHVRTSCSSLSTFSLTWDQPPEQEEGEVPSGVSGQNPWHKKLWVTVAYNGEKLHLANVSVINTATTASIWTLTDNFGEAKFRVPKGQYIVKAEHPDYGFAEKKVLLEDHMEIEIDIAKGSPLTVFPTFDFGEFEFGVLVLPIAIFVIYALTLIMRKPKKRYRYSYLR